MYEPRVVIDNVNITLDFENDAYNVVLSVKVPSLNATLSLRSVLNQDGYEFT